MLYNRFESEDDSESHEKVETCMNPQRRIIDMNQ